MKWKTKTKTMWISIRKRKKKTKPTCTNCEFMTSYQMLNNRDEHVDVNYCLMLSTRINSVKNNYMENVAVSIIHPENFDCRLHKLRKIRK